MCLQHRRPASGEMNPMLSVQISSSKVAMASDGNTESEENCLRADKWCKQKTGYTTALVCRLPAHKLRYCLIRIRLGSQG